MFFSEPDMPDHDLEPPRFSRRAFERLLNDWPAVKSMIMSGTIRVVISSYIDVKHGYFNSKTANHPFFGMK